MMKQPRDEYAVKTDPPERYTFIDKIDRYQKKPYRSLYVVYRKTVGWIYG